uniref:U-megalopygitoxin(4)-Mo5 n=1 Tax=Megalopyge opercularis TaxID=1113279 RepID=TXU45_MEGOP|nr:venom protein U-MPTX.4-5 [Megalopyge opercularis]
MKCSLLLVVFAAMVALFAAGTNAAMNQRKMLEVIGGLKKEK